MNFKTSVESSTSSLLKGGIGSWNKNMPPHPEGLDTLRHNNQMKLSSVAIPQQQYNGQQVSEELHQPHTDLLPPFYHSQHNEFIQNDIPSLLSNHTIQSTSNPSTR